MPFSSASDAQERAFLAAIVSGDYTLLLGAGASHDSRNHRGNLPLGSDLLRELAELKGAPSTASLQRVFKLLTPEEIEEHITQRFVNTTPGPTALGISSYNWRQIFTFNVDDSIEAAYRKSKRQRLHPIHFAEPYESFQTAADLPLIFLHGSVNKPNLGYVFSRDQYIRLMKGMNPWMVLLSAAFRSEPLIISGASLDEVDLEYYLSFRDEVTSREDAPPSIFVSSDDGVMTQALCEEHGLLHFKGHSIDFFDFLKARVPNPPLVDERISAGVRDILPGVVDRTAAMQFDADFELVPKLSPGDVGTNKFYYGSPPTWADLASNLDIPRTEVPDVVASTTGAAGGRQVFVVFGATGSGKTAALKRIAYNLASRGQHHVLWASELGRMSRATANTIDAIDGSIVMVVDNLADHVQSISDVLSRSEREDIVIIGGERSYRRSYIDRTLGSKGYESFDITMLKPIDVQRLVRKLTDRMLVGSHLALKGDKSFYSSLRHDPIAVATCRVLNDFRPLSRIIGDLIDSADARHLEAFSSIALCSHCFKGGVRFQIASTIADAKTMQSLISGSTGLSLRYVDGAKSYVTVENSTIADEILFELSRSKADVVLDGFVAIANAIAPYVNRNAIRARSPEARLSGRLFDFDDVVEKFLKDRSSDFYEKTKDAWKWNSRYWEQTALLKLSQSERVPGEKKVSLIEEALQNARYSVAIEVHPFGLTTLGKVLMRLQDAENGGRSYFDEACISLYKAIDLEGRLGRTSMHPYATLISGSMLFIEKGGTLTSLDSHSLRKVCEQARRKWPTDKELTDAIARIQRHLQ